MEVIRQKRAKRRPDVPEECGPFMGGLIRRCWSEDPSDRPSFDEILREFQARQFNILPGVKRFLILSIAFSCGNWRRVCHGGRPDRRPIKQPDSVSVARAAGSQDFTVGLMKICSTSKTKRNRQVTLRDVDQRVQTRGGGSGPSEDQKVNLVAVVVSSHQIRNLKFRSGPEVVACKSFTMRRKQQQLTESGSAHFCSIQHFSVQFQPCSCGLMSKWSL
jgi:hypothetical protein